MNERNGYNYKDRLMAVSIALAPFFSQYSFLSSPISLAEALLFAAVALQILTTKGKIYVNTSKHLIYYFLIGTFLTMISVLFSHLSFSAVSESKIMVRIMRYGLSVFLIFMTSTQDDISELVLKTYKYFAIVFSIYAILQAVVFFSTHILLPVKILPISWNRETDTAILTDFVQKYYFRCFGTFMEPGYLVKYLAPAFAMSLFGWGKEKKSDVRIAILIGVVIVLSTSLQGIAIATITVFAYIFLNKHVRIQYKIGILVLAAIGLGVLLFSGIGDTAIDRINGLMAGTSSDYSSKMRLFRGFAFLMQLPLLYKFIGVGIACISNYAIEYGVYTAYDHPYRTVGNLDYVNGVSSVLVYSGVIGFSIILIWIASVFKRVNNIGRIILMQLMVILLSGSALGSISTLFMNYWILCYKKDDYDNNSNTI